MQDVVLFFRDEYRFLSNFFPARIVVDEIVYPTVEHAYQAEKTKDEKEKLRIRDCETPGDARKLGKAIKDLPADWEKHKYNVMAELVERKFENHPELMKKLLDTGTKTLVEGNFWHDKFWGICFCISCGQGQNKLGRILHSVRFKYNPNWKK